jgi:hypothetical protein
MSLTPLIPANAGTRITNPKGRDWSAATSEPHAGIRHLGPGIRRDERVFH